MDKHKQCLDIRQNKTLDRTKFTPWQQGAKESLEQFWIALNGPAANFEFDSQTTGLLHNSFVFNIKSLTIQEKKMY